MRNPVACLAIRPLCRIGGANIAGKWDVAQHDVRRRRKGRTPEEGHGDAGKDGGPWVRVVARGEPLPQFDLHARLLTLPGIFDSTPDSVPASVPYLHVDDAREERVGRVVERALERDAGTRRHGDAEKEDGPEDDAPAFVAASPRPGVPASAPPLPASPRHRVPASSRPTLRVGLVWQGNTAHKGDRQRSIALAKFAPLAQVPGVRLVSLQKGFGSEQVAACNDEVPVVEWSDPADTTAEALLDTAVAPEPAELLPA